MNDGGTLDHAAVEAITSGTVDHLLVDGTLRRRELVSKFTLFPGAFNPLHEGHRQIAEIAGQRLRAHVVFELSMTNVDKATLTSRIVLQRLAQFKETDLVCLTQAATFVEKARLFPNTCFVVGADTIVRIADDRYYDSASARHRTMDEIVDLGCSFLVFGRKLDEVFNTLETLDLPDLLRFNCRGLSEDVFRADVCSTELRDRED